jgi:hypothetical protein
VLDLLGHLVDKSLVIADGDDRPRYRCSRRCASWRWRSSRKPARHRRCCGVMPKRCSRFSGLAIDDRWNMRIGDQIRLGAEIDNLRTALDWAESAAGDRTLAWALLGSSGGIWLVHSLTAEGIRRALRVLPLPAGVAPEIEARLNLLPGCSATPARAASVFLPRCARPTCTARWGILFGSSTR